MAVNEPTEPTYARDAESAAKLAVDCAEQAERAGTYGVGAVLIDNRTRKVIATVSNDVVRDGRVHDPTAHAERQLIDWYYDEVNLKHRDLPKPQDLTIVSSLDPCMMCCGAVLKSGFNVAVLSHDVPASADYTGGHRFVGLPTDLRLQAQEQIAYFGVAGKRPYQGSDSAIFAREEVSPESLVRAEGAFMRSRNSIKQMNDTDREVMPEHMCDPSTLPATHPVVQALRAADPAALTVRTFYDKPGVELWPAMCQGLERAKAAGSGRDAVSVIDPFGNVLMTATGQEARSPIRTAYMEFFRNYAGIRAAAGPEELPYLPHPKYLKFVSFEGPGRDPASIMNMGARAIPATATNLYPMRYVAAKQDKHALQRMLKDFPSIFADLGQMPPKQIEDQRLQQEARRYTGGKGVA